MDFISEKMIVVIGASAGGPRILKQLFTDFPLLKFSGILVQHMPEYINESIVQSLSECTKMYVRLAKDGDLLEDGIIAVIPSDVHARVIGNKVIRLDDSERVHFVRPAVDVTMQSLIREKGVGHIGIVLTGMGRDGAQGICHMKAIGGLTIAQDKATSIIFGMPKEAIETGCVDWIMTPEQIHLKLISLIEPMKVK